MCPASMCSMLQLRSKLTCCCCAAAGIAMLNGDSEPPLFSRPFVSKAASPAAADKSLPQLQPDPQPGSSKRCSLSFSSDSAHVPVPQAPIAPGTPAQTHNKVSAASPQGVPTISPIALPNGIPAQTPVPPLRTYPYTLQPQQNPSGHQAACEAAAGGASGSAMQAPYQPHSQATNGDASQTSSFSSSLTAAQQQSSNAASSQRASSASPAPARSALLWRSNPAYGMSPTPTPTPTNDGTPSSHRASQSLPSFKAFTSVDRRLTDSWRAKLLEDLANDSDSEQSTDMRSNLPVVSEHASLPALTRHRGLQSTGKMQHLHSSPAQTHPPAQDGRSRAALLSAHAHPALPDAAISTPSHRHMAQAPLPSHNSYSSDVPISRDCSQYHVRQPQQHLQPDRASALNPEQGDMTRAQAAADVFEDGAVPSMLPPPMAPFDLLSDSNLEVVKARSNMLDIPSAELLDSILDFANAVCGEQQNDAYSPLKVTTSLALRFAIFSNSSVLSCTEPAHC